MMNDKNLTEYEKALYFLNLAAVAVAPPKCPEEFAELRSKSEEDIFLMAQLRSMDGGAINTSRCLRNKTRINKRTIYCWNHNTLICQKTYLNMLGIGRNYFENI